MAKAIFVPALARRFRKAMICTLLSMWTIPGNGHILSECFANLIIEGDYKYRFAAPLTSTNIENSSYGRFQVITADKWVIQWMNDSGHMNPSALYASITASTDGSNVFVVREPAAHFNRADRVARECSVYPWTVPSPRDIHPYNLWLGLIAPRHLTEEAGVVLSPNCGDLSLQFQGLCQVPYRWFFNDDGYSIATLYIFYPAEFVGRDFRKGGKVRLQRLPKPFDHGFLFARGHWTGRLDALNRTLPVHWSFSCFAPKENAKSTNDLAIHYSYELRIRQVRALQTSPAVPAGFGDHHPVFVRDHRFARHDIALLSYRVTNDWWTESLSLQSPMVVRAEKYTLNDYMLEELGFKKRFALGPLITVFRSLLVVTVILPVIVGAIIWLRKTNLNRKAVR